MKRASLLNFNKVTIIGIGKMGTAIAETLLSNGIQTTVWNRTKEKVEKVVSKGAIQADTLETALQASSLVIICMYNYQAVRQVLNPVKNSLEGRAVINLTSGSMEDAQFLSEWLTQLGADYLDGAMLAIPQTIGSREATILFSGSKVIYEHHQGLLHLLAGCHYYGEEAGMAELYDMALLSTSYATLAGFLHAMAMLDSMQVKPSEFISLLTPWLNSMVAFLPELGDEIENNDYSNGTSNIDINQIAIGNLVNTSLKQGIPPDIHLPLQVLLNQRVASGHSTDSFSSLVELLKKSA